MGPEQYQLQIRFCSCDMGVFISISFASANRRWCSIGYFDHFESYIQDESLLRLELPT